MWGRHFLIRTDHYSLKFLLEQRIITSPQQHWLSKLMGFDFAVEYRAGRHNIVADALSRITETEPLIASISGPEVSIFELVRSEIQQSDQLQQLLKNIQEEEAIGPWEYKNGLIFFKGRVYLLPASPLVEVVLSSVHNGSHEGYEKTLHRVAKDFYWKGMKTSVQSFVQKCHVCQRHKSEHLQPAGLLQPLPVPLQIWSDISMDFIDGLPPSQGKTVLLVVVDRFSKYAHLLPLSHPYTAVSVARLFFDNIFKLHGLPETIVTDRDVTFTSSFWRELFRLSGSKLCFTSAYHPQSDGQTEVVNRTIEMYLRCFTSDRPRRWFQWLPWVEYCYNTSYHSSLKTTPFEVVYGRPPPSMLSYCPGLAKLEAVDQELRTRDLIVKDLRDRLLHAQNSMKVAYDTKHRHVEFKIGDMVLLKLHPHRQLSLKNHGYTKLSPRYYGPFKVIAPVGSVAYKLELPSSSKLHPVFHVSCLKPFHGNPVSVQSTLPTLSKGELHPTPQAVLEYRVFKTEPQALIHWEGLSPAEASWEDIASLRTRFPSLVLEDKHCFKGGSNVTTSTSISNTNNRFKELVYHKRGKQGV